MQTNTRITPETAPIGARLLIKERHYVNSLTEITILEWTPDGSAVKYRPETNPTAFHWSADLPKWGHIVSVLPTKDLAPDCGGALVDGAEAAQLPAPRLRVDHRDWKEGR